MAYRVQIKRMNPFHKQLALYLIANPSAKLPVLAKHFKKTQTWISIVKNSDAFKVYYQSLVNRQLDNLDPILQNTQAMTELALDAMNQKLETIGTDLSVTELKEIADMGLKRLGFGAPTINKPSNTIINNSHTTVVVDRGELESARKRMAEAYGVVSSPKQIAAPSPRSSSAVDEAEVVE